MGSTRERSLTDVFRVDVTDAFELSPNLRRIRLHGESLREWVPTGKADEFIRITIPDADPTPGWEDVAANARIYTVRRWDPASLTIDVDVVVHGHGRGSTWGLDAKPGDQVGVSQPRGYYDPPAGSTRRLLIADAAGLPAVARILEEATPDESFDVLVELMSADDAIALPSPADVTVQWRVSGNGRGPSALLSAMERLAPADDAYIWIACETAQSRAARNFVRDNWARHHSLYRIVGYWHEDPAEQARKWQAMTDQQRERYLEIWNEPKPDEVKWLELEPFLRSVGM